MHYIVLSMALFEEPVLIMTEFIKCEFYNGRCLYMPVMMDGDENIGAIRKKMHVDVDNFFDGVIKYGS